MPIQYTRDDAKRRIRLTLTNPITVADLIASVERQLASGGWPYGSLVEARAPFSPQSPRDMRAFSSRVSELVATHGQRGPIAIIAKDAGAVATAQIYVLFGGKTESVEVFWDLDDGQHWLDDRMTEDV
jgi:hypothetical protein